ncbi:hypothetical protein PENANT_c087G06335 [Penicillium antarcticum]|uniref:Reverse transcriptase Ty1/copia-type domain-containing protein n=1 Tax=Penicillium antarcticum TaxID=416450 RepID=A0A1V6PN70_9EURO|nr:hypothetical protein PENANT_c087G06335 [Penicillium antarcticum]
MSTAFLYGEMNHEIYVEQRHHATDGTSRAYKLRKALYGPRKAPRIWYQTLTNFLRNLGFEPINTDLSIFVRSSLYIAVQEAYVHNLQQFRLSQGTPVSTPMETSPLPESGPEYICPSSVKNEYQHVVRSLILGGKQTLTNPGPQHVKLARRILRHLKSPKSLSLAYKGQLKMLRGFTDADWAGCHQAIRSTAKYLINIGSGAISWQSKRQNIVTLSTCEADHGPEASNQGSYLEFIG